MCDKIFSSILFSSWTFQEYKRDADSFLCTLYSSFVPRAVSLLLIAFQSILWVLQWGVVMASTNIYPFPSSFPVLVFFILLFRIIARGGTPRPGPRRTGACPPDLKGCPAVLAPALLPLRDVLTLTTLLAVF